MLAARLHMNDFPDMVVSGNDDDPVELGLLNKFEPIRQLKEMNSSIGNTTRMGVILRIGADAVFIERPGPWLERNLFLREVRWKIISIFSNQRPGKYVPESFGTGSSAKIDR